jgi:hypothetical protein
MILMEARAGNEVEADWRYEREGIVAAVVVRHRTATGAEFVRPEFFARQHVPVDKIKSILVSGVFVRGRGMYLMQDVTEMQCGKRLTHI